MLQKFPAISEKSDILDINFLTLFNDGIDTIAAFIDLNIPFSSDGYTLRVINRRSSILLILEAELWEIAETTHPEILPVLALCNEHGSISSTINEFIDELHKETKEAGIFRVSIGEAITRVVEFYREASDIKKKEGWAIINELKIQV